MTLPKISIVTPSYQHAAYIEQTLRSVLEQGYPNLEYIVVDGGSTDGTVEILKRIAAEFPGVMRWTSERDHGQTDAINKGLRQATGAIMAWVNSDDYYAPGTLTAIADFFTQHPDADFVYGDVIGLNERGDSFGVRQHVRQRQTLAGTDQAVLVGGYDFIVQPATFWRARLWQQLGELDESLRYTMDYEYWMRAAAVTKLHYLPRVLAYERLYGGAKTGSGQLARIAEIEAVARRHGGDGLPRSYRAEGAGYHLHAALSAVRRGQWSAARQHVRAAMALKPRPLSLLKYVIVFGLFGPSALPKAWLWVNRLRTLGQRQPG